MPNSPQNCSAESDVAKRLLDRVKTHDRMTCGSDQALGYYSSLDAKLMREAADEIERLRHDLDRHMQIAVDVLNDAQSVGMREALALCEDVLRVVQEVDKVPESPIINLAREKAKAALAAHGDCSAGNEDALGYAQRLATILWEKHWKDDAPNWKPLPDLVGVLTQIDNATAGLMRAVPQAAGVPDDATHMRRPEYLAAWLFDRKSTMPVWLIEKYKSIPLPDDKIGHYATALDGEFWRWFDPAKFNELFTPCSVSRPQSRTGEA